MGEIGPEQYGFIEDSGTRNAIFTICMVCKACDKVRHEGLMELFIKVLISTARIFACYGRYPGLNLLTQGGTVTKAVSYDQIYLTYTARPS